MDTQDADAAPTVLADLIAAGLVSHELIGDPARLGGESAALRALCALVAGPVYRIDAYHYAFRAMPGDLDGGLADLVPGDWTGALEEALAEKLGDGAVWINATDLLPEAGRALAAPLLLLRAQDEAVSGALEKAGPGLQAVINARYASECARLSVTPEADNPLDARLAAIEARQEEILAGLEARSSLQDMLAGLSETLAMAVQRIDAQGAALTRLEEAGAAAGPEEMPLSAGFEETLGVTLAEFLARIDQQAEEARTALRVPQFS